MGKQIWKGVNASFHALCSAHIYFQDHWDGGHSLPSFGTFNLREQQLSSTSLRPEQPGMADKGLQPPPQAYGTGGRKAAQCQLLMEGPYTCLKHWGSASLKNIELFLR